MKARTCLGALIVLGLISVGCRTTVSPNNQDVTRTKSTPCSTGAKCVATDIAGREDPKGTYIAQCTGRFADYVDLIPADYSGSRFQLSQDYPQHPTKPAGGFPWDPVDFRSEAGAVDYLMKVRDYVYEGMIAADWRVEANTVRKWYHVPWMHVGRHPREFLRGMTEERPLAGPELGVKNGVTVQNWAVGFYNDLGAQSIGKTWTSASGGDPSQAQANPGTVVAKLLFSAALPSDFESDDILAGAPEWDANVFVNRGSPEKNIRRVRLLQMDVAIRDPRAGATGWIFGTFAYDKTVTAATPWDHMIPVGLMWGNDPSLTPSAGTKPKETIVNPAAPLYARNHLGLAGRMNGPVDNPASACMSCHSTAQTPPLAPMTAFRTCSETQTLHWFRNLPGTQGFGAVNATTCVPTSPSPASTSLDYSLQQSVAFQNYLAGNLFDPCTPAGAPTSVESASRKDSKAGSLIQYPVER